MIRIHRLVSRYNRPPAGAGNVSHIGYLHVRTFREPSARKLDKGWNTAESLARLFHNTFVSFAYCIQRHSWNSHSPFLPTSQSAISIPEMYIREMRNNSVPVRRNDIETWQRWEEIFQLLHFDKNV